MTSMTGLPDVQLGVVAPEEIPLAAALAARGMADNPTSLALFGDDRMRRIRGLEPMFGLVLSAVERSILCARRQEEIVGIAAMTAPNRCLFRQSLENKLTLRAGSKRIEIAAVPRIPRNLILPLLRLGLGGLARVSTLSETHIKHDPPERHQHVELVAVEPALQGLGIGRLMMEELCREIDRDPSPAWLETDTESNVRFYRHYGFEVADEATVLGMRNWYMRRG